jgi:hypothetical protein
MAGRRHFKFARIGLCISDEFGNRLGWSRKIHFHDARYADNACNRRDVADEIEIEVVVERRVDRIRRSNQQESVAIRRRSHYRLGGNIAAGTRPVFDNERLAEPLR